MNKISIKKATDRNESGVFLFSAMALALSAPNAFGDVILKWNTTLAGLPKDPAAIQTIFGVGAGQAPVAPSNPNTEDSIDVQTNALASLTLSESARYLIRRIQEEGLLPTYTNPADPNYLDGRFTKTPVCLPLATLHHPIAHSQTTEQGVSCGQPLSLIIAARNHNPLISIVDPSKEKSYLAGFMILAVESAIKELNIAVANNSVLIPAASTCAEEAQIGFLNRQSQYASLPGLAELSRCISKEEQEAIAPSPNALAKETDTFCSSTYHLRGMIFALKTIYASTLRCRAKELAVQRYFERVNVKNIYKKLTQEAKKCMDSVSGDFPTIQESTRTCLNQKITPFFQNEGRAAFPELGL